MRIAICCDPGIPSELLRDALTVGKALIEREHSVAYVGDPVALVDYAGGWTPNELYQAPVPRVFPPLVMRRPPENGLTDRFAVVGFDDKATLITLATVWNRQLDTLKPDVIVGFYAPVLWLVGPAHAPTLALGNGYSLPPVLGTSFPRLSVESPPIADEERMLANANAVLARLGQSSVAALSEILDRCISIFYGVPAFDPYSYLRKTLSAGLLGDQPTPTAPPPKPRLVALLDIGCPNIETIVLALVDVDQTPVDVCVIGATTGMMRYLGVQPNVKVWNEYAILLKQSATAGAIVHHGAQDVAQRCIAIGRPQLLIPWTREQSLFAETVQWMGFTRYRNPTASIEEIANAFREVLGDTSLTVAAQHHSRQLADANLPDALPAIVERIERLGIT